MSTKSQLLSCFICLRENSYQNFLSGDFLYLSKTIIQAQNRSSCHGEYSKSFTDFSSIALYFFAILLILGTVTPINLSPSPYPPFSVLKKAGKNFFLFGSLRDLSSDLILFTDNALIITERINEHV